MTLDQSVDPRPVAGPATGVQGRGNTVAMGLVAAGAVLLTIVVHYTLALDQKAPWLMGDELRYAEMAKSFLDQGKLYFREAPTSFATAYPALIAPAWAADEITTTYQVAKAINVVLMTLTAAVVFVWARRLVTLPYSFVAAGLVLLMPTFVYTGMLMMENAALPAFVLGAFVIARALERPTLAWQLAVFVSIGLATLLRIQLVTLTLVYATAIFLAAFFARRAAGDSLRTSLRRFLPSLVIAVVGALLYLAVKLFSGGGLASGLGAYDTVAEAKYDLWDTARWSLWHVGELTLSVGFLPAAALGVLLAVAFARGGLASPADRAFVAVASASAFWFVLQAAAFASRFSERIEERYMVYAAPLLLLALLVWLQREVPRRSVTAFVAALVPALLVMTIPYERLFNVPILADTLALIPFLRLSSFLNGGVADLPFVLAAGLALATIAFLVLSMRTVRILFPAALALFFLLSSYTVYGAIEVQSAGAAASTQVSNNDWVDDAVGASGDVGFVYSGSVSSNPHLMSQTEFWNRSVDGVYAYGADPIFTYGATEIALDRSGRLVSKAAGRTIDEEYVLADPSIGIVGDVVAKPGPLALIRLDPPARIGDTLDGVYADRWSGPRASLSQYTPLPNGARRMRLDVSRAGWGGPDVPGEVEVKVGPLRMTESGPALARVTASRRWTVHANRSRTFVLPVPAVPFRVEVQVTPTFSPSQFGHGDTRQLGAQLSFAPAGAAP